MIHLTVQTPRPRWQLWRKPRERKLSYPVEITGRLNVAMDLERPGVFNIYDDARRVHSVALPASWLKTDTRLEWRNFE